MKDTDQIAAEATKKFCATHTHIATPYAKHDLKQAFKSAIEKARTIGLNDGYAAGTNDAIARAAHANDPWTREKVHQWFGEPTVSNKVADKIVTLLNSKPAHASEHEWAYNYEAGYWAITKGVETINGKTFGGPLIGIAMSEKSAKDICDAHNCSRPQRYPKCDR